MATPAFCPYALVPRGNPGLACDDDGVALGPLTIAKKVRGDSGDQRYRSLPPYLLAEAFRLAYGAVPDAIMERRCRGIIRVSQLLEAGADALARIHAVLLGFPQIAPDGMAKLAAAASLRKYNPDWQDQTRVPAGNSGGGR